MDASLATETTPTMPAVSYAKFQAEVLEIYAATCAPATVRKMRQALREFGAVPGVRRTSDLVPVAIARWLKLHPGRSPATTQSLLSAFRAACGIAATSGYVPSSPFAGKRKWVHVEEASPDLHLPAADVARLLAQLDAEARRGDWKAHRLRALGYLVALTGVRKLEALGLEWGDVDAPSRLIRLRSNSWRKLKTPKSGQPVPMPPALREVLADWRARRVAELGELVFPNEVGRLWSGGLEGYRALDRLRQAGLRAGVAGVTFQALRQSWATHAESLWGLSGPAIARVLRQTTETTSKRHYRKADEDNLRAIGERIRYAG